MKKCLSLMLALALCAALASADMPAAVRYEFEDGALLGNARALHTADRGWVENIYGENDGVTLTVSAPADGFYDLTVCQAGIGGYKENYVLVDGEPVGNTVAEGLTYGEHTLSHIWLTAGEHQITIAFYWGNVRLDYLDVTPSAGLPEDLYDVEPVLCNPNPSEEAQALFAWMCEVYGDKMISGQYLDEGAYGAELRAVASVTGGLYPAMVGLDFLNYSPSSVSLGTHPSSVDQAIRYWEQGYIVTMCWHWVPPVKYLDTTGNNWWGGFNSSKTTLDLDKVMNGEDPEGYELLISDMDAIAVQMIRLRDAGVPILWRPLHEASGGWFWWGDCSPESYIKLYRLMYDRFTNVHGLNNLIWVWNGQSAEWYPGDDVVDIIGEDIYAGHHAHESQSAAFMRCINYTSARKMIIMSECGCVPSPIKCGRDGVMWGSWAVWCYEFVLQNGQYSGDYNAPDTLKMFYEQDNVITLKDVPAFGRTFGGDGTQSDPEELSWDFMEGSMPGNARVSGDMAELWGNDESDTVTLVIDVPADGEYTLVIRQQGIGGGKENYLYLDGELLGNTVVQGEEPEDCVFGTVTLTAGEHEIKVGAFWGWTRLDTLTLIPADAETGQRYEFEENEVLGNASIVMIGMDGFVRLASNDETDGARVTIAVEADGYYDLTIVQAGIGGYKENYLTVDDERIGNTVVQGEELEACVTEHVWLTAGEHTVTVTCFWGWANLDALIVTPSAEQ